MCRLPRLLVAARALQLQQLHAAAAVAVRQKLGFFAVAFELGLARSCMRLSCVWRCCICWC